MKDTRLVKKRCLEIILSKLNAPTASVLVSHGSLKPIFQLKHNNRMTSQLPHWKGEVGLCTDFPQLALETFQRTSKIDVGSAVISILAGGGPIPVAERIANTPQFLKLADKRNPRWFFCRSIRIYGSTIWHHTSK